MSKKNHAKNQSKSTAKKQSDKSASKQTVKQNKQYVPPGNQKKSEPRPVSYYVRLIIVILLVLGLAGSMSVGIIASAYSLPLTEEINEQRASNQGSELKAHQESGGTNPLFLLGTQSKYLLKESEGADSLLLSQTTMVYDERTGLRPAAQKGAALLDTRTSYAEPLPGDLIDGKPAEEYLNETSDLPEVYAPMAAVCTKDGRILYERNIDEKVTMASTTKMMTAIVALESADLNMPLTVTYGAANADGTHSGLEAGMTISMLDCLYALLLPSGNDAAMVIAENISGMESRFVELMNAKAAELGMTSTHYVDSSGLSVAPGLTDGTGPTEEDHYTTVRDYLALARYCMENATFREIVGSSYHEVNIGGKLLGFQTTDSLGEYMVEATPLGIKTGYTDEAGYCFVGAGDKGGVELYSVVFNAVTAEQRFADTAALLEWGLRHYRTIEIINTSQQVAEVALASWIDKTVAAYVPTVVRAEVFDLAGPLTQDITIEAIDGEATKGQSCGSIIWSQAGEVLTTSEVVVAETVLAPDFWEGISIGWQRFWGGFFGDAAMAETVILLKNELAIPAAESSDTVADRAA